MFLLKFKKKKGKGVVFKQAITVCSPFCSLSKWYA